MKACDKESVSQSSPFRRYASCSRQRQKEVKDAANFSIIFTRYSVLNNSRCQLLSTEYDYTIQKNRMCQLPHVPCPIARAPAPILYRYVSKTVKFVMDLNLKIILFLTSFRHLERVLCTVIQNYLKIASRYMDGPKSNHFCVTKFLCNFLIH